MMDLLGPSSPLWLQASMRHQDGTRHVVEHVAGGAAENEFAQAAVAIGAHDEEPGIDLYGMPEQRLAGALAAALDRPGNRVHLVALEHCDYAPSRLLRRHAFLSPRVDADDIDRFRRLEQRQRVVHRTRGLASAIPADDDAVEIEDMLVAARQDEQRAPGADEDPLDAVEFDARYLGRIGGAGDDDVGGLAMADDLIRDERRAAFDGDELVVELGLIHRRLEGDLHLDEIVLEEGLMALEHLRDSFEAGRWIDLRGRDGVETAHKGTIETGDPDGRRIQSIETVDFIEGDENGLVRHLCFSRSWARSSRAERGIIH